MRSVRTELRWQQIAQHEAKGARGMGGRNVQSPREGIIEALECGSSDQAPSRTMDNLIDAVGEMIIPGLNMK